MAHAGLPRPVDSALLERIDVRPSLAVRLVLTADLARSLAQAAAALLVPRLIARPPSRVMQTAGALLGLPFAHGPEATVPAWLPWGFLGLGLLTAWSVVGCFTLRPSAMAWRRRMGLLAVAEVLFAGVEGPGRGVAVTLWQGAVWVALLVGGLALSREVARITGEEGLEVDPARRRL